MWDCRQHTDVYCASYYPLIHNSANGSDGHQRDVLLTMLLSRASMLNEPVQKALHIFRVLRFNRQNVLHNLARG